MFRLVQKMRTRFGWFKRPKAGCVLFVVDCALNDVVVFGSWYLGPPLPLRTWEIIALLTRCHLLLTVDTKQEVLLQREDGATSTRVSGETGVHTTHDSSSFSQVPKYSKVDQDLHPVQASHLSYGLTVSFMT